MDYASEFSEIRSIQIQPGPLLLKEHLLETNDLIINYYSTNQKIMDHSAFYPNDLVFILGSSRVNGCKWCGIDVPINTLAVLHAQREHLALLPPNFDYIGIMLKTSVVFREYLLSEYMWKQTLQPETAIFNNESLRISKFRNQLLSYFQSPERLKILTNNQLTIYGFNNWIFDELGQIFSEIEENQHGRHFSFRNVSRRYRLLKKTIDFIEESLLEPLTISQICNQIGTTPRTLQLCFKELLGISPFQYIKARKLHAVRENLFYSEKSTKFITHLSQDYGFQHSGRFSSQYQHMFGELPKVTLKRRR